MFFDVFTKKTLEQPTSMCLLPSKKLLMRSENAFEPYHEEYYAEKIKAVLKCRDFGSITISHASC